MINSRESYSAYEGFEPTFVTEDNIKHALTYLAIDPGNTGLFNLQDQKTLLPGGLTGKIIVEGRTLYTDVDAIMTVHEVAIRDLDPKGFIRYTYSNFTVDPVV